MIEQSANADAVSASDHAATARGPNEADLRLCFVLTAFGATVRVASNDAEILARAKNIAKRDFIGRLDIGDGDGDTAVDYSFGLGRTETGAFRYFENGVNRGDNEYPIAFFNYFSSMLRLAVAERAWPWVFVHAGVVRLGGRTIVIPGNSFSGKSTLVAELVKSGAEYYSDEYALLDENGLVHPFPRPISLRDRSNAAIVVETAAETLGGRPGKSPATCDVVLFTEFLPETVWDPTFISLGNGIKELLLHTIPLRFRPQHAIKVLNTAASRAIILKGARGDTEKFVPRFLSFLKNKLTWP